MLERAALEVARDGVNLRGNLCRFFRCRIITIT